MSASSGPAASISLSPKHELEARASSLKRLHNQPGIVDYRPRSSIADPCRRCCRTSGPRWSARSYCPLDGH